MIKRKKKNILIQAGSKKDGLNKKERHVGRYDVKRKIIPSNYIFSWHK